MHITNDEDRGLYGKYRVERLDGSSEPGGKHEHCRYFVLDIDHDPHAIPALIAYGNACEARFPLLAKDLSAIVQAKSTKTPPSKAEEAL